MPPSPEDPPPGPARLGPSDPGARRPRSLPTDPAGPWTAEFWMLLGLGVAVVVVAGFVLAARDAVSARTFEALAAYLAAAGALTLAAGRTRPGDRWAFLALGVALVLIASARVTGEDPEPPHASTTVVRTADR